MGLSYMHDSLHTAVLCGAIMATATPTFSDGFSFSATLEGEYAPELPVSGFLESPGFSGPQALLNLSAGGNDATSGRVYCQGRLDYTSGGNQARGHELMLYSNSNQFHWMPGQPSPLLVSVHVEMLAMGRLESASSVGVQLWGFFASDSMNPVVHADVHISIENAGGVTVHESDWTMPEGDQHEYAEVMTEVDLPAGDYRMRLVVDSMAEGMDGVDLYADGMARFNFNDALFGEAQCPSDLSVDGLVDGADLGLLLSAFGTDSFAADFDNSGLVDGGDLGVLLAAWGPCAP
jgi:hypothetical protein